MNAGRLLASRLRHSAMGLLTGLSALLLGGVPAVAAGQSVEAVHVFTPAAGSVIGPLVPGPDGHLYGNMVSSRSASSVFRLSSDGMFSVLPLSSAVSPGANGLTLGPDGWLYGSTHEGGAYGQGTLYRVSTQGRLERLHSFNAPTDGGKPNNRLMLASDGYLYGATAVGGPSNEGTVFRIAPGGEFDVVHAFDSEVDGTRAPRGPITEGSDGMLYATGSGGDHNGGTVFRMKRSGGGLTVLHAFWFDGRDGYGPGSGVVEGPDGRFYGVANGHRLNRHGVVFRLERDGHLEVLFNFPKAKVDGREPFHRLARGRDGALYGSTAWGGPYTLSGTLFRVTTDGVVTTLHQFDPNLPVGGPAGNELLETAEGEFLGATSESIYRWRLGAR
ncbi:MAG: choice-of-anchor tandem repeat GloVer-containing protein [Pseudomonadota bacterium]